MIQIRKKCQPINVIQYTTDNYCEILKEVENHTSIVKAQVLYEEDRKLIITPTDNKPVVYLDDTDYIAFDYDDEDPIIYKIPEDVVEDYYTEVTPPIGPEDPDPTEPEDPNPEGGSP